MTAAPRRIVVTDANVLINLMHVTRLSILGSLPGLEFVVPDHVRAEITDARHASMLDDAARDGCLRIEPVVDLVSLTLFAELVVHIGRGEAACLALAVTNGWMVRGAEVLSLDVFACRLELQCEGDSILGGSGIARVHLDLLRLARAAGHLDGGVQITHLGRAATQLADERHTSA